MSSTFGIRATGIRKAFGAVEVLHGIDLHVDQGSLLALLGENGAGKSTLVKILAGAERPDAGTIELGSESLTELSPATAQAHGIRMIHQEFTDAPSLSVAENIFLGQWPKRGRFVDWRRMAKDARRILQDLGTDMDVHRPVGALRVGERQLVEVARAMVGQTRVLILDEPTAALSANEGERLFGYLRKLRQSGVAIIYITHRLDEVQAVADRVQVLRDGHTVLDRPVADTVPGDLVAAMLGRTLEIARQRIAESTSVTGTPMLTLSHASSPRAFTDISLEVSPGEVVALYGNVGSGIGEVTEAIYGARRLTTGTITMAGSPVHISGPPDAVRRGIGLLPGDRQREGAFMQRSVAQNMCAPSWARLSRHGWITERDEARAYRVWHDRLQIRSRNDPRQLLATLSGGNQQKVLLGRWLAGGARVLLLVEPTRGVDVGARQEIYRAVRELAGQGVAVLLASSDHEEVMQLADRSVVMVRGRATQSFSGTDVSSARLVAAAGGRNV